MSENIQTPKETSKIKNFFLFVITILTVMILSYISSVFYDMFVCNTIYSGVIVDEINAGGLTKEALLAKLKQKFDANFEKKVITIKTKDESLSLTYPEMKVKYDPASAVQNAFDFGRKGSIARRFLNLSISKSTPYTINVPFSYDKPLIAGKIDYLASKVDIPVKEYQIVINEPTSAAIISGHHGENLNKEYAINNFESYLKQYKHGDLNLSLDNISPKPLLLDEVFGKITCEPKNPYPEVSGKNIRIIPPVMGRKIEKEKLSIILTALGTRENCEETISMVFSKADITIADIEKKLFTHDLATYSTQFYTGDTNNDNRKTNISIAADIIDGTLLGAGQTFSFNKIVGPRNPENGYKNAHAYEGGKIVDSTGGGICQVSTTLYNALLVANLTVNERHNHMFTVGYVPKGMDAAVSYGSADLIFQNSTAWPLRINSWVTEDNRIYFSLTGTNENPEKSYEYRNTIKQEIPIKTENSYDSSLLEGTKIVTSEGMLGYEVDTTKITKINGVVKGEEYFHTSSYAAYPKQIKIGTKKPEKVVQTPVSPSLKTASSIPQRVIGVDDASNPPVKPSEQ